MQKLKNSTLLIIFIAVIIGFISGATGMIITRVYFLEQAFNVPLFGDLSFNQGGKGQNLVISGAKKVVVEQNIKINDTVNEVKKGMIGIYEKKNLTTTNKSKNQTAAKYDINKYYNLSSQLGLGFAITSDGWLVSSMFPQISEQLEKTKIKNANNIDLLMKKYVLIDSDNIIYEVDRVFYDEKLNSVFWHISKKDLPVRKFTELSQISNGQMAIAINSNYWVWLTSVLGDDKNKDLVRSSDAYVHKLMLEKNPDAKFSNSFLFDLNGDLLAMINQGIVYPTYNYTSIINSLQKGKTVNRASLGINYIDLSEMISTEKSAEEKGALVYKNNEGIAVEKSSQAEKAGIIEGDIILSVNNMILDKNNDLSYIISQYAANDTVVLTVKRGISEKALNIKLGELK